ncbi:MAG: nitrate/nitrite transporter [Magnetococcales bacterium]|nr:nitrate/nitrite transporter [Magnetococcales bacterium]
MSNLIREWNPENENFWDSKGKAIARKNLWISIPSLFLSFALWMVWSVVVVKLPTIGFDLTTDQLFWLAALPGLSGATLRVVYSFMIPIWGGRLWTTVTTFSLLIPAVGMGLAVQDLSTPYEVFLMLAILSGFGGGNFASSMANIAYFYPKKEKGHALALNAGLGNLGVSAVQFLVPIVITLGFLEVATGNAQTTNDGSSMWLQNAAFFWIPFVVISGLFAWFGMNDINGIKSSFKSQSVIFKRRHNWIMCVLYVGTFGSFIGFSAAFPLLAKSQFPEVNSLQLAFLGPLVGALSRALSGKMCDRIGGGKITLAVFVAMLLGTLMLIYFLSIREASYAFYGFFGSFILLFIATGVGNASTFQMIPTIFWKDCSLRMKGQSEDLVKKASETESAATIGFTSALGAYGAFFIPKTFGFSLSETGEAYLALILFSVYYALCILITWVCYLRKDSQYKC